MISKSKTKPGGNHSGLTLHPQPDAASVFKNVGEPAERCRQLLARSGKVSDSRFYSPWRRRSKFA